ncbi:hypothetical protein [Aquimarina sp. MMG016]|uniref:hypothetical protein n=1 Tax=Aquimarina sp. MMG016 TaxID=2822690 RepID=UPI001B3A08DE|nr:hypothetical protein [Aquimarina sp. MMG016]MBQ4820600.1 hypothetical protein [Aquimarina sp. MMG016]
MVHTETQKFSESDLWQLQRQYFQETNIDAWQDGDVPHYATSNPYMADTYAELLIGIFRDRNLLNECQQPIYIVELGTGSGRFSFHLLQTLSTKLHQLGIDKMPFIYVMTDFVEETLAFWDQHPKLQSFFEQGILDYALFDVEKDTMLHLAKSKIIVDQNQVEEPIIAIANYFFDSIPQDLYYCNEGNISNALVKLEGHDFNIDMSTKEIIENLEATYILEPVASNPYANDRQNQLLEFYQHNLSDSYVLFPHIGIRCIDRLKKLSKQGLVLITADKAAHELDDWQYRLPPFIAKHGSFSITANYHAIKEHCHLSSGKTLFPEHPVSNITVGLLFYVNNPEQYKESQQVYHNKVFDFGPDDFFSIKKHIEKQIPELGIKELFTYIRLSNYDARLFQQFLFRFQELCQDFTDEQRHYTLELVHKVWQGYYPMKEEQNIPYQLGELLYELRFYEQAIDFFKHSEDIYGTNENTIYCVAVCYYIMEEDETCLSILDALINKKPDFEPAKTLYNNLTAATQRISLV